MAGNARRKASNFFVWIILGLLIVGLAGFGIGNFGGSVRSVAAVGETEIDVNTYSRTLQERMTALMQARGEPVSLAEARQMGLDGAVLQGLLATAAIDEAARQAGLSVGDAAVSAQILEIPAFQGGSGFDREAYQFALDRAGLSVAEFEASIRAELARNLFQVAVVGGIGPSPTFADTIFEFVGERRDFTYLRFDDAVLSGPVAPPDAAEIRAYYDDNSEAFTRPEQRRISYVLLTPDMLIDDVQLDETALRDLYADRADQYRRPEQRIVERLIYPDPAAAEAARGRLDAGEAAFADLVAERGLTLDDIDLGPVSRDDLDTAAEAVFALDDTGIAGPVETALGPALFRVNAILAARETSYEDALPELREELARQRAARIIEDEVEPLNDLLAGGATLEELSAESDVSFGSLDWHDEGDAEGIAAYPEFRAAAASVTTADFPEIIRLQDGGIFALRLDEIVPPTVPAFESIEAEVAAAAQAARTRDALRAAAESVERAFAAGEPLPETAPAPVIETGLTRRDFLGELPPQALETAFELEPGATAILDDDAAVILMRLDAITPADPADPLRAELRASLEQQVSQSMAQEVLAQLSRAIEQDVGITINQSALNAVHAQMP